MALSSSLSLPLVCIINITTTINRAQHDRQAVKLITVHYSLYNAYNKRKINFYVLGPLVSFTITSHEGEHKHDIHRQTAGKKRALCVIWAINSELYIAYMYVVRTCAQVAQTRGVTLLRRSAFRLSFYHFFFSIQHSAAFGLQCSSN